MKRLYHAISYIRVFLLRYDIVTCLSKYRQGLDWWLGLLTIYTLTTRDYTLQITDTHTYTHINVLDLLQSPLAVFWQQILT